MVISGITSRPFTANSLIRGVTGNNSTSESTATKKALSSNIADKNADAVSISFSAEALVVALTGRGGSNETTSTQSRSKENLDREFNKETGATFKNDASKEPSVATSTDFNSNQEFSGYDKQGKGSDSDFPRNPNKQPPSEKLLDIVA